MLIRCKDEAETQKVKAVILVYLAQSRFNFSGSAWFGRDNGMTIHKKGRRWFVKINGVRLNARKDNCGNHGGPCLQPWRPHRTSRTLEGMDWIAFDDMLNDALDSINFDGDVYSSVCILRKGRKRRTSYVCSPNGDFYKNAEDRDYQDFCGRLVGNSEYPEGTPGIQGWRSDCVEIPAGE